VWRRIRGGDRHLVRGVGAQRAGGADHRRLQPLGRARPPDALARRLCVWELFVPGVGDGNRYKFEICGPDGLMRRKADPMASLAEQPPATASVVFTSRYEWADDDWLDRRRRGERSREPLSIYEVHLGSWRPGLSYLELAEQLTAYVTSMGFTHVEF